MERLKVLMLIWTLILISQISVSAQNSSNGEWQVLFNGEDLNGWHLLNGQHKVEVKDGVIIATSIEGLPNGFIATKEEFGDFILELEVKADMLLHNSGIQFRSLSLDEYNNGRVHGYQAEVDITPQAWSGGIYDEARRGWLYILEDDDSPAKKAWVNNQWNHYRIEAIGTTNRVWVNGIPTSNLEDDETTKGFIALQIHANSRPTNPPGSNRVFFRNIRIQTEDLQPSEFDDTYVVNLIPNDISPQEDHQGFELLFDGKTTTNWRGITEHELPENGWNIDDGILTIVSTGNEELSVPFLEVSTPEPGGGIIMTEKKFRAFELKFDFKQHKEGAIAGLEYLVDDSKREARFGRLAAKQTRNIGRWNQGAIKVQADGHVEYWLNGYPILEYQRGENDPSEGHILFDDYGATVSYRSMKIRELN